MQLPALPEWIGEANFDVAARYPPATAPADTLLMLHQLLEQRFHMVLKHRPREFSGYALIVGMKGPEAR